MRALTHDFENGATLRAGAGTGPVNHEEIVDSRPDFARESGDNYKKGECLQ